MIFPQKSTLKSDVQFTLKGTESNYKHANVRSYCRLAFVYIYQTKTSCGVFQQNQGVIFIDFIQTWSAGHFHINK